MDFEPPSGLGCELDSRSKVAVDPVALWPLFVQGDFLVVVIAGALDKWSKALRPR